VEAALKELVGDLMGPGEEHSVLGEMVQSLLKSLIDWILMVRRKVSSILEEEQAASCQLAEEVLSVKHSNSAVMLASDSFAGLQLMEYLELCLPALMALVLSVRRLEAAVELRS